MHEPEGFEMPPNVEVWIILLVDALDDSGGEFKSIRVTYREGDDRTSTETAPLNVYFQPQVLARCLGPGRGSELIRR